MSETARRYRKRPIVIEAIRWDGKAHTLREISGMGGRRVECDLGGDMRLMVETPEGTMAANVGDYIIKGVKGEIYPCRADVFDETYEEAGP